MTVAVCTNCGKMKFGALCFCSACNSRGLNMELDILLSDHNLTEEELETIGIAIKIIYESDFEEHIRFHILAYFLSIKWPKLIEYNIDLVKGNLRSKLVFFYQSRLDDIPGQMDNRLKVSTLNQIIRPNEERKEFAKDDTLWQFQARSVVSEGIEIAGHIVIIKIAVGEGALFQKWNHSLKTFIKPCDYNSFISKSYLISVTVTEYQNSLEIFCSKVKNGWSDRTKQQARYLRSLGYLLEKMASNTHKLIEHKAKNKILTRLEYKRARKEINLHYKMFISQSYVVYDPERITTGI